MSVITAILSGLPLLGKLIDRFFPDRKDERAEMRRVIAGTRAFKAFLWLTLGLAVLEVLLKAASWMWPDLGLPETIVGDLDYYKIAAMLFAGIGG